jgi:hypothetical protein
MNTNDLFSKFSVRLRLMQYVIKLFANEYKYYFQQILCALLLAASSPADLPLRVVLAPARLERKFPMTLAPA